MMAIPFFQFLKRVDLIRYWGVAIIVPEAVSACSNFDSEAKLGSCSPKIKV
jgi:hypothetical protein